MSRHWTQQERVNERSRLEGQFQLVLTQSELFNEMNVGDFKRMSADLRDCLRKWTAVESSEGK